MSSVDKKLGFFERVFREAADPMFIHRGGRFIDVNEAACEHLLYSRDELMSMRVEDTGDPESIATLPDKINSLLQGEDIRFEAVQIRKDGSRAPVEVHSTRIDYDSKPAIASSVRDITQRKAYANQLEESVRTLENVIEHTSDLILISDQEGYPLIWNQAYANAIHAALGVEMQKGKKLSDVVDDPEISKTLNIINKKAHAGKDFKQELSYTFPNGRKRHFELLASPIKKGNTVVGFSEFIRDITERKEIEEQLLESQRNLIESQRVAGIGSYVFNIQDNHWSTSEVLNEIFGIDDEVDHSFEGWIDIVHPEDREMMQEYFIKYVLGKKELFDKEYRITRKADGATRWAYGKGKVEYSADGKPTRMIGTIQDITDHKEAREAAAENEERIKTFFETLGDGVGITRDGKIVLVNQSFLDIYKLTMDDVVGKSPIHLVHEEDQPLVLKNIHEGWELPYEHRGVRKDGSVIYLQVSGRQIMREGKVERMTVIKDITEMKKSEEEKHRLEAQLEHSRKLEAVGHLASGIAHDFNNLLMIMVGAAEVALTDEAHIPPDVKDNLQDILKASNRGSDLTKQLISLSRESGYHPHNMSPIRLGKEVISLLQKGVASSTAYSIESHLSAKSSIYADPSQLHQIISNLALNARDAMPDGGTISISMVDTHVSEEVYGRYATIPPGNYVKLEVTDTGTGIPAETIEYIFDPFFTTKKQGKGSGLGLASVWSIVDRHKAYLDLTTSEEGTTFAIYFQAQQSTYDEQTVQDTEPHKGQATVLIVDDEDGLRANFGQYLHRLGYRVMTAHSAATALQIFNEEAIDAVISDVVMYPTSGIELSQDILGIRKVPYILMSGYACDDKINQALQSGVSAFVPKPARMSEITGLLEKLLGNGK